MKVAERPQTAESNVRRLPSARRQAVLVVGMHRSGTSAVTNMIHLLGAKLPEKLYPAGLGNELGHWEPTDVIALHDKMLESAGSAFDSVFGVRPSWFESAAASHFVDDLAGFLQTEMADSRFFVIKDPRLALFVPIWLAALERLDIQPLFVVPFRSPNEVEASLRKRQNAHAPDSPWADGRGTLLWMRYVLDAEKSTRSLPRAFVQFDALLDDWRRETRRLAEQLDIVWPTQSRGVQRRVDQFLDRQHKHETIPFKASSKEEDSPWVERVYAQLQACVDDPGAGASTFDGAEAAMADATTHQ